MLSNTNISIIQLYKIKIKKLIEIYIILFISNKILKLQKKLYLYSHIVKILF